MLRKTALHEAHLEAGAKMGEFAGYDMPLYYKAGVKEEHNWTRTHAGIFDVSHMGQVMIEGQQAAQFLERITPSNFADKKEGRAQYTVLTNEDGGIIDDLIVTRFGEKEFYAVVNGACKENDIVWMKQQLPGGAHIRELKNNALIAIQGRWAERAIYEVFEYDAHDMGYMTARKVIAPCGNEIIISRLGYTGEDGFEVSLPNVVAAEYWEKLLSHSEILPIGLAARDSLRLEMGYPLYGHDIDETTSPVEADIAWIIGKNRTSFIGEERILKERAGGTSRKRVGIKLLEKGVAREGAEIRDADDQPIGTLTSGGFSPILEHGIGMGYVPADKVEIGTPLLINVRGRNIKAEITQMPFMAAKTKSMKKPAKQ